MQRGCPLMDTNYIICGLRNIGMRIVAYLHENNHDVVVIERDCEHRFLHTARSLGVPIILEDANLDATLQVANFCAIALIIIFLCSAMCR